LLVDSVVFVPLFLPLNLAEFKPNSWNYLASALGISLVVNSYNVLMHWRFGQTLGKMAVGVRVVNLVDEGQITLSQAVLRDMPNIAFSVLSSFAIFYLLFTGVDAEAEAYNLAITYPNIGATVFFFMNVAVCISHPLHRAIHDLLAGTVTIRPTAVSEEKEEESLPDEYEESRGD
jgi:uncharacterized RDD family membrane protein YckC